MLRDVSAKKKAIVIGAGMGGIAAAIRLGMQALRIRDRPAPERADLRMQAVRHVEKEQAERVRRIAAALHERRRNGDTGNGVEQSRERDNAER